MPVTNCTGFKNIGLAKFNDLNQRSNVEVWELFTK